MNDSLILEPQRLTSPTVKVRRLGYLVAIPSIVNDREIPIRMLKKQLLDWAKENGKFFMHYSLSLPVTRRRRKLLAGEIKTIGAASRYIKTCEELGLIVRMKGFKISKIGKAVSALPISRNPFELRLGHLFVILKLLLEKDYDSLRTLLKILTGEEKDEVDFFRKEIQRRFYEKVEKATRMNKLYLVDELKTKIRLVGNWKSPHRYYHENIKAPRLEWMLDLKFLKYWNQRNDAIDLQNNVRKIFQKDMIGYKWLQDEFPYFFADFYSDLFKKKMVYWSDLSQNERLELLSSLMSKSMEIFETGPQLEKISASEFFEYSLAFLVQNRSIVTSLSRFENDLIKFIESGELKYRYVQTVSAADRGYIVRL